jgi:hypothetical protein
MAETVPRRNAAVYIDLENLFGGYSKSVGSVPLAQIAQQLKRILASDAGTRTTSIRAYANWALPAMQAYQRDLLASGIEAVQVFSFTQDVKNAADLQLCVDALAEERDRPWTETFVIVSGDGGFVPLVRRLRQLDKRVIVASTNHPAAGTVNHLLASAADEYHVLNVAGTVTAVAPEADTAGAPTATAPELAVAAKAAPKPPPAVKAAGVKAAGLAKAGTPTLEQYRGEIRRAVKRVPGLLVGGAVDGSRLGQHLRKKWPGTTFKDFGSATLGGFVEAHCGLTIRRPVPAKKPQPTATAPVSTPPVAPPKAPAGNPDQATVTAEAPATPSSASPSTKAQYLRAVRMTLQRGPLAEALNAEGRVHLATVGSAIRTQWPDLTPKDAGYPKLLTAVEEALVGTPWRLRKEGVITEVVSSAYPPATLPTGGSST